MHTGQDWGPETEPPCDCNGEAMRLVKTWPKFGPAPELRSYRCERCGEVCTVAAPDSPTR